MRRAAVGGSSEESFVKNCETKLRGKLGPSATLLNVKKTSCMIEIIPFPTIDFFEGQAALQHLIC
jgi:hypothetical protein